MLICTHSPQELRVRTLSNGTTAIYKQCLACGEATSNALPKTANFGWERFPAFSEELRESYRAKQRSEAQEVRLFERVEHTQRYRDYLKTPAWQRKCELVYERENGQCQGCRQADIQETHHLTYAHVFDELLFELAGLCSPCHRRVHGIQE